MNLRRVVSHKTPSTDVVIAAIFGVLGFVMGARPLSDNSFFWHLRTGTWMLDHGVVRSDPFSFTASGRQWTPVSWLAEVVYGTLFRSPLGAFGIRVLAGVVGAAVLGGMYLIAIHFSSDRLRAAVIPMVMVVGMEPMANARPVLLGLGLFAVLVVMVERPEAWFGRHARIVLPLLMWLWINVHGSWLIGFGYLGVHVLGQWFSGAKPWDGRERTLVTGALCALPLLFLNPYGYRLVVLPTQLSVGGGFLRNVNEWRSPDFSTHYGVAIMVWIALLLVGFFAESGRAGEDRRLTGRDLLVVVVFLALVLSAKRNMGVFYLATAPILARALIPAPGERRRMAEIPAKVRIVSLCMIVVFTAFTVGMASRRDDFDFEAYPVKAMQYIEQHDLLGKRLAHSDFVGGYLILTRWPEQRVFVDDRYNYPTTFLWDYLRMKDGRAGWQKALDRQRVEVVVWAHDAPLASLLSASPRWRRVTRADDYDVFVRRSAT